MNQKQIVIEQEELVSFESGLLIQKPSELTPVQPYDNKYIYKHDTLRAYKKSDLARLIDMAKKYLKSAPDMSYVIITDQGRCLFLDAGTQLCPTTTFNYHPNKILHSFAKFNGQIIPNFINVPEEIESYMYTQSLS